MPEDDPDEVWMENAVESSATEEQYLEFLANLRSLTRITHMSPEDTLSAISHAIDMAAAGSVVDAGKWVERVALGMIGPAGEEDEEER
jgi:hypothetical protein